MSQEQGSGPGQPARVVDRRRFRGDGEPVEPGAGGEAAGAPGPAPAGGPAEPQASDAQAKLAAQAARIDELTRAYAALVDDNRAFRARVERESERVIESERTRVVQALLEAADELERALSAVSGATIGPGEVLGQVLDGVRLTLAGLSKRIAELGAKRLEVVGGRFDPRTAEAVDVVPVADAAQDEVVLQEVRAGYRIGERVLRPARVRVGRLARA